MRRETKRRYDRDHRAEASDRQRSWPWRKAAAAAKQARRVARKWGLAEGDVPKEVFARLQLLPCVYCGAMPATEVDHATPMALGGPNAIENLVSACSSCNQRRGTYVANALQGKSSPAGDLWSDLGL